MLRFILMAIMAVMFSLDLMSGETTTRVETDGAVIAPAPESGTGFIFGHAAVLPEEIDHLAGRSWVGRYRGLGRQVWAAWQRRQAKRLKLRQAVEAALRGKDASKCSGHGPTKKALKRANKAYRHAAYRQKLTEKRAAAARRIELKIRKRAERRARSMEAARKEKARRQQEAAVWRAKNEAARLKRVAKERAALNHMDVKSALRPNTAKEQAKLKIAKRRSAYFNGLVGLAIRGQIRDDLASKNKKVINAAIRVANARIVADAKRKKELFSGPGWGGMADISHNLRMESI